MLTRSQTVRDLNGFDPNTAEEPQFYAHIEALESLLDSPSVVLVTGNPVDGIQLRGPFDNRDEAGEWAHRNLEASAEWWTAEVEQVDRG